MEIGERDNLNVPVAAVRIVTGETRRTKRVSVAGVTRAGRSRRSVLDRSF
jgi:uncharacterized protein YggU (UPF0235/DUF167 family)